MGRYGEKARKKVERAMHERKRSKLRSGRCAAEKILPPPAEMTHTIFADTAS